jgi:hypothetical protein
LEHVALDGSGEAQTGQVMQEFLACATNIRIFFPKKTSGFFINIS